MAPQKTKIVLDADVINHFVKGGILNLLPKIFPEYQFVVLDIVKKELPIMILSTLETQIRQTGDIHEEVFGLSGGEVKEFLRLTASNGLHYGRGESACMVYCRYHNDVVGSSNTKDVTDYCNMYGIIYLTTNDFLYYAIKRGILTVNDVNDFIRKVRSLGSFPPIVNFETYICTKL